MGWDSVQVYLSKCKAIQQTTRELIIRWKFPGFWSRYGFSIHGYNSIL